MNKSLRIALFCVAASCSAQPALTPIQDTIYNQFGALYTGSLQISLSTPSLTAGGSPVLSILKTLQITNGVLNVSLVPNDTASPALTSYVFRFGNGTARTCTIPTSVTPITLANYCTNTPPVSPTPQFPLSWVNLSGYANGFYCVLVNSGVGALSSSGCPGGGSSAACLTTVVFSSTPTFDFSTCPQQKIVLAGNVTPAISNAAYCQIAGGCTITFVQGSAASYTVTWTGAVIGGFTIGAQLGKRNVQSFTSLDGSTLLGLNPGEVNQ